MVIFSDSQLRPIVQGNVKCPADWYVNCTPGAKYSHVTSEIRRCTVGAALVYLLVGTNELGKGLSYYASCSETKISKVSKFIQPFYLTNVVNNYRSISAMDSY